MAVTKTIPAGLITKPVIFKKATSSLNDEGGQEVAYSNEIETRAYVTRFNQYRTTEAEAAALIGAFDFYIRWRSTADDVTKEWLIEYEGKDFVIHQIEKIDEGQRFLRFTAKSIGNAVISGNSSSVGDYAGSGGGIPAGTDMSHLEVEFVVPASGVWIYANMTFVVGSGDEPARYDWGDGTVDDTVGGELTVSRAHHYAEGTYTFKFYPIAGFVIPTGNAVSSLYQIEIVPDISGGDSVTATMGNSLTACTGLHWLIMTNMNMTTFPDLPYGPQQVSLVRLQGNSLDGTDCSNIYRQLDEINWPVGEVNLTGSPGVSSLSAAGLIAKQNLINKFWTVTP